MKLTATFGASRRLCFEDTIKTIVSLPNAPKTPGGGGGGSYMKETGMLVVSLRGVNFGFWSRLGCSGESANILSRQDLV